MHISTDFAGLCQPTTVEREFRGMRRRNSPRYVDLQDATPPFDYGAFDYGVAFCYPSRFRGMSFRNSVFGCETRPQTYLYFVSFNVSQRKGNAV